MKKVNWIASCANILCLIHCVGFGLLGLFSPLLLVWLEHIWWVDWGVLSINLIFGNLSIVNMGLSRKYLVGFNLLLALAFLAVYLHQHSMMHYLILAMAVMQVTLLVRHHKKPSNDECCDHQHH